MSYNVHKRQALDTSRPILHRMSHARSCTVITATRHGVRREEVIQRLLEKTGLDLMSPMSDEQLARAMEYLEYLRENWNVSE